MASIRREIALRVPAEFAWDAIRDVGAPHTRLARGFVVATKCDPGERTVTFGNGLSARELIVDLDDARRRFAYSIVAGSATHHHAVFEVRAIDAANCTLLWTTDVLPHNLAEPFSRMVDAGIVALRATLESDYAAQS